MQCTCAWEEVAVLVKRNGHDSVCGVESFLHSVTMMSMSTYSTLQVCTVLAHLQHISIVLQPKQHVVDCITCSCMSLVGHMQETSMQCETCRHPCHKYVATSLLYMRLHKTVQQNPARRQPYRACSKISPLVHFEELQDGKHNVIDKAESRCFSLLSVMQATCAQHIPWQKLVAF